MELKTKIEDKKVFTRIGFAVLVCMIVVNVVQVVYFSVLNLIDPGLLQKPWVNYLAIAISFYLIGFPIFYGMVKKLPEGEKKEVKNLSIGKRISLFFMSYAMVYIINFLTSILIMLVGSFGMNLNATVAMIPLLICTIAAVLLALVLEFFAFGGDYSRAERLEYEDDEYFYYVKAVPKASVATSERSIKKINAEPVREERKAEDNSGTYANPIFRQDEKPKRKKASPAADRKPRQAEKPAAKDIDFEKKLEESLKDL